MVVAKGSHCRQITGIAKPHLFLKAIHSTTARADIARRQVFPPFPSPAFKLAGMIKIDVAGLEQMKYPVR